MAEGLNMSGAVLRVDPQVMYAKSREAALMLEKMRRCYEKMDETVRRSEGYWLGEAGELHRTTYRRYQEESENVFRRLQEHVAELNQMGQVYEEAERAAEKAVEDLSSNVIL